MGLSCLANYQFRISLSNHDGGLLVCQRFKESDREGRERNGTERKGGKEWNGNQVGRNKPRLSRRPCGESREILAGQTLAEEDAHTTWCRVLIGLRDSVKKIVAGMQAGRPTGRLAEEWRGGAHQFQ
uniref:HDC02777 n=1 Tax=Drosophila melanogaster TaxID=7227 RepID=Q6IHB8_DROME|nr:TPA_inf: HDC02777 [Drosophila melanogaster]